MVVHCKGKQQHHKQLNNNQVTCPDFVLCMTVGMDFVLCEYVYMCYNLQAGGTF